MMNIELSPLGGLLLVLGLVGLSAVSAGLAAWQFRRRERSVEPPSPVQAAPLELEAVAALLAPQLQALQYSQVQLRAQLEDCVARLSRAEGRLATERRAVVAPTRPEPLPAAAAPTSAPAPASHRIGPPHEAHPTAAQRAPLDAARPESESDPAGMPTPLPRPQPIAMAAEPARELTDEELDALPPELPASAKPRKRILPAPKKPTLQNL